MTMLRQLRRRLQMKSKIALFFMILISFLLQCTLLHVISIGSITPNLILILCISMGLMRGRKSGLWTGFFCGFLVDMFYGSVFGFYALIYMYIGFLSGYAHRICYDDDIKVPVMLAGIYQYKEVWYCLRLCKSPVSQYGRKSGEEFAPEMFSSLPQSHSDSS